MFINRVRKVSLLLAGFVILAVLLHDGMVLADSFIPKPATKPQAISVNLSTNVPLPLRKPNIAEDQSFKVATVTSKDLADIRHKKSFFSMGGFSSKQARLYREIFDFQEKGAIEKANQKIKDLNNPLLIGHILAQRYLHPAAYKATYKELHEWMDRYADHSQAQKIYKLALSRKPMGFGEHLKKPVSQDRIAGNLEAESRQSKLYKSKKSRTASQTKRTDKLFRDIRRHVSRREPTLALNILSTNYAVQFIDDVEYDQLHAHIAAGYLFAGKREQAAQLSQASLKRSGSYVPLAGWVRGLAHWQEQNYGEAASAFEMAARSPYASGWLVSAAAYWASRAHMRSGNIALVEKLLELSATYPRTFYGLIATRSLGRINKFDWSVPTLKRKHIKFIEETAQGRRAAALIAAGQIDLAESELRNINPGRSIDKQEALLAYAHHHHLPALSMQLGNAFNTPKGGFYDAALYPVASWKPKSGYRIDQALIYAIIRQESRFRVSAQNPSGATGLMQLMPATANYIAGTSIYENASGQHQLKNPEMNLDIGQAYIERLLNHKSVGQDLLSLAIAYNAGPGNLSRWKAERSDMLDPLLFIETIPYNETRAFVERVLSNYWIYRMRLKQDTPSLDAVAQGKWARYAAQDNGSREAGRSLAIVKNSQSLKSDLLRQYRQRRLSARLNQYSAGCRSNHTYGRQHLR